jgi:hypothetical protein
MAAHRVALRTPTRHDRRLPARPTHGHADSLKHLGQKCALADTPVVATVCAAAVAGGRSLGPRVGSRNSIVMLRQRSPTARPTARVAVNKQAFQPVKVEPFDGGTVEPSGGRRPRSGCFVLMPLPHVDP